MHIRRAAYPALAGTLGGGSVFFAKAAIELIKGAILGDPAFKKVCGCVGGTLTNAFGSLFRTVVVFLFFLF